MMNFQGAGDKQGMDRRPIPKMTVVKARITLSAGQDGTAITKSNQMGSLSTYLKSKVKIVGGDYNNRVIFHNVGRTNKEGLTEGWGEQGDAQIKAILEHNGAYADPSKYQLNDCAELHDRPVLALIDQEVDKSDGTIKNVIAAFLSPNPASQYHDLYLQSTGQATAEKPQFDDDVNF